MTAQALLKKLAVRPAADETLDLLRALALAEHRAKTLMAYHEHLLFYKAYPVSEAVRRLAERELAHFDERITPEVAEALSQSGISGTTLYYAYDIVNARFMSSVLGKGIEIDWEDYEAREKDPLAGLLWILLEDCEADAADSEDLTVREILEKAAGDRTVLDFLLDCFEHAFPAKTASQLWDDAGLTLAMTLTPKGPSRSNTGEARPKNLWIWNPAENMKSFDFSTEILRPLKLPVPAPRRRAQELLNIVHGTLLVRSREYFGATHGSTDDLYEIPLDRGATLLFWFATPEWRLPQETGLGFVMLKNGVPISYGGGGAHPARLEIAVNLFDTFRGGEAAWVYAQLIRSARAFYHAPWCVARRYQVGHENEEGLASGSYWFYYKLGFRSVEKDIRKLAESERRKILKQKGYRTPKSTLKQLAEADVVLALEGQDPAEYREFPLDLVSLLATEQLKKFVPRNASLDGRILEEVEATLGFALPKMSAPERHSAAQQGLLLLAYGRAKAWSATKKQTWVRMARGKGSVNEANYLHEVMDLKDYFDALAEMALKK